MASLRVHFLARYYLVYGQTIIIWFMPLVHFLLLLEVFTTPASSVFASFCFCISTPASQVSTSCCATLCFCISISTPASLVSTFCCFRNTLASSDLVWLDSFLPSSLEPLHAILLITAVVRSMAYFSLNVFFLLFAFCAARYCLFISSDFSAVTLLLPLCSNNFLLVRLLLLWHLYVSIFSLATISSMVRRLLFDLCHWCTFCSYWRFLLHQLLRCSLLSASAYRRQLLRCLLLAALLYASAYQYQRQLLWCLLFAASAVLSISIIPSHCFRRCGYHRFLAAVCERLFSFLSLDRTEIFSTIWAYYLLLLDHLFQLYLSMLDIRSICPTRLIITITYAIPLTCFYWWQKVGYDWQPQFFLRTALVLQIASLLCFGYMDTPTTVLLGFFFIYFSFFPLSRWIDCSSNI